jgi:F0F1-type ATP synthase membrane subunit b/b'
VGVRRRQKDDEELIQGEPSVPRGSPREGRREMGRGPEVEHGILNGSQADEGGADQHERNPPEKAPEGPSVAEQASGQVETILGAAEEAASEIRLQARNEAGALRERLRAEAQAEADRIRMEAQADARETRTEAHAAAVALREEAIAELRTEVERTCARLGEDLLVRARATIDTFAGAPAPAPGKAGRGPKGVASGP